MANTRIFELAKELGIKSKAIVEKCHAEGIPKDVIKNHMSTISIGLEQTVREWFSSENTEESPHTAVEKTENVDLEKGVRLQRLRLHLRLLLGLKLGQVLGKRKRLLLRMLDRKPVLVVMDRRTLIQARVM